jgi:hypothetical protein
MSGEAVVLTSLVTGPAGLILVAGVGAQLVAAWMETQHALAQERMRKEKQKVQEWQRFHQEQQQEIERLTQQRERLHEHMASLRLAANTAQRSTADSPLAQGFVLAARTDLAEQLDSLLANVPAELFHAEHSPFQHLLRQARALDAQRSSARPPPQETLHAFHMTVERTLAQTLQDLEREAQIRQQRVEQAEGLLSEAITYHPLTDDAAKRKELAELQEHLIRLLTTDGVTAASLDLLNKKWQPLKTAIDQELEHAAVRHALRTSTRRHLETLGYQLMQPEMTDDSIWGIPGGEQVRVALQRDNRLAFQMAHERTVASEQPLSEHERVFLRQQEARWCQDLHTLLRRLQEDGFEFSIQLEREVPESSIPVVIVEDVDEWFEEGAQRDEPHRRRFT